MSDEELRKLFAGMNARFDQIDARLDETNDRITDGLTEVNAKIDGVADDVRHEMTLKLGVAADDLKHQIQLVAESDLETRRMLNRRFDYLDEKIDRNTEETRAMMKFGYDQLDRRVTAIEQK